MRSFLPIKGPGGRHLTPNEKAALLVLGFTLVFCLLTLLAGESAFDPDASRNPVFAVVSALCRWMGGGVVALYALVLVWSGLIYFKGERIAQVAPFTGRLVAALAVMVGISGALGVARLETAGALGRTVGHALQNAFGPTASFPILFALMILGLHLAGRGAWTALREPTPVGDAGPGMLGFTKTPTPSRTPGGYGIGIQGGLGRRTTGTPMPDDGDPTSEERSVVVARAVADIERRKGVTILEVSPSSEVDREETAAEGTEEETETMEDESTLGVVERARASIGEEVDTAPPPPPDTEEADVQRRLHAIDALLGRPPQRAPIAVEPTAEDAEVEEGSSAAVEHAEPDIVDGPRRPKRYEDEDDPYSDDDEEEEDEDDDYEDDDDFEDDDEEEEDDDEEDEDDYDDDEEEDEDDYDDEEDEDEDDDRRYEEDEDEDREYEDDDEDEDDYSYDDEEENAFGSRDHGFVPVPADDEPEPQPLIPRGRAVQTEFPLSSRAEAEEEEAREPAPEPPVAPDEGEPFAEEATAADEPEEVEAAPESTGADPYARPGLLDRLDRRAGTPSAEHDSAKSYASFDWRGRPIE